MWFAPIKGRQPDVLFPGQVQSTILLSRLQFRIFSSRDSDQEAFLSIGFQSFVRFAYDLCLFDNFRERG